MALTILTSPAQVEGQRGPFSQMPEPHARVPSPQPWERFGATASEWRDWRWQQRRAVRTEAELARHLALTEDERSGLRSTARVFRFGATPYYLSLCDPDDAFCPVRMQVVPRPEEAVAREGEREDPLGEEEHRPVRAIIHKYPDRLVLLAIERCSVYCRHCTRRRITGAPRAIGERTLEEALDYVRAHREVRDVLISGGDPLLLSTGRLERLLSRLRAIRHVEIVRIGTRLPVCNPVRVTGELTQMLRRYHPLFLVTHFNHPKEITPESSAACGALVDAGIPVENQTVLLRRINSSARILRDLFQRLLTLRVRPYYLHQMDVALGVEHLRTPLSKGVEILGALRGHTSGLAVPHLALDLPGGGGKVTLQPDYTVSATEREAVLRSYSGALYRYPEPAERDCSCPYEDKFYAGE